MDIFELQRRFEQINKDLVELRKRIDRLEFDKADKVHYPQYSPAEWPQSPKWVPFTYPTYQYPNVTCSTGEKV